MEQPFSKILEEYQLNNGYTNAEMAMIIGISERMYVYYLKGEYKGSDKKINKYLRILSEHESKKETKISTTEDAEYMDIVREQMKNLKNQFNKVAY